MNKIIIVFSGMSCSGYSETAQKLINCFPASVLFSSSNFFDSHKMPTFIVDGREYKNCEDPTGIKWSQLIHDIENCTAELIFISSFVLFYSQSLRSSLKTAIIFEYSENELNIGAERRMNRGQKVKQKLDFSNTFSRYYRDVVWPKGWGNKAYWDGSNSTIPMLKFHATEEQRKILTLSFHFISQFCPVSIKSIYPIQHFSAKIIVGFSGMSTSGKTSTAQTLLSRFTCASIISTDKFFDPSKMPFIYFEGKQIRNWEEPVGVNWEEIIDAIKKCNSGLIFIDSFLLFYSKEIVSYLNAAIVFHY
jgi:uridine kinase